MKTEAPPRGDVIAAQATPVQAGRRAVVRISGRRLALQWADFLPRTLHGLVFERGSARAFWPWLAPLRLPIQILMFPGPGSATGEDVIELHLPGSQPFVDRVLQDLYERGVRPAEPGEFTRRAFLNGRLDLTQAEAVLHLVQSRQESDAEAAAALLQGVLGQPLQKAREVLITALSELEASLDFEEGDAQDVRPTEVDGFLRQAIQVLQDGYSSQAPDRSHRGQARIGLWGRPNSGKSSLFNSLTGRKALVSSQQGTTRDALRGTWRPRPDQPEWQLWDRPGVGGQAVDSRDAAARRLADKDRVDLWWWVLDGSIADPRPDPVPPRGDCIVVWNKLDLGRRVSDDVVALCKRRGPQVWISALTGAGLSDLEHRTAASLATHAREREQRRLSSERHCAAVEEALRCLRQAQELVAVGGAADLVAEEVRAALHVMSELVGRLTPEDLLDRLFGRFCIGK